MGKIQKWKHSLSEITEDYIQNAIPQNPLSWLQHSYHDLSDEEWKMQKKKNRSKNVPLVPASLCIIKIPGQEKEKHSFIENRKVNRSLENSTEMSSAEGQLVKVPKNCSRTVSCD